MTRSKDSSADAKKSLIEHLQLCPAEPNAVTHIDQPKRPNHPNEKSAASLITAFEDDIDALLKPMSDEENEVAHIDQSTSPNFIKASEDDIDALLESTSDEENEVTHIDQSKRPNTPNEKSAASLITAFEDDIDALLKPMSDEENEVAHIDQSTSPNFIKASKDDIDALLESTSDEENDVQENNALLNKQANDDLNSEAGRVINKDGHFTFSYKIRDLNEFFRRNEDRVSQLVLAANGDDVFGFHMLIRPNVTKVKKQPKSFDFFVECINNDKNEWTCKAGRRIRLFTINECVQSLPVSFSL